MQKLRTTAGSVDPGRGLLTVSSHVTRWNEGLRTDSGPVANCPYPTGTLWRLY